MQRTVRRVGPAILASGLTVIVAMLVLLVAEVGSVHTLGPVAAIGVFCVLLAGLTILPALLTISGRRGFWPRQRLVAFDPEAAATQRPGVWRRIGDRVLHRPVPALIVTVAFFGVGALGLLALQRRLQHDDVLQEADRQRGRLPGDAEVVPGRAALPDDRARGARERAGPARRRAAARRRLAAVPGVAQVRSTDIRSRDGRIASSRSC